MFCFLIQITPLKGQVVYDCKYKNQGLPILQCVKWGYHKIINYAVNNDICKPDAIYIIYFGQRSSQKKTFFESFCFFIAACKKGPILASKLLSNKNGWMTFWIIWLKKLWLISDKFYLKLGNLPQIITILWSSEKIHIYL